MTAEPDGAELLLDRVLRDPESVIREVTQRIEGGGSPEPVLLWARGLARRELSDLGGADRDLSEAASTARAAHDEVLAARVEVSLAAVAMSLGEIARSHDLLDAADTVLDGPDLGRAIMQRGLLFHRAGELERAVVLYERALPLIEAGRDRLAETRLRLNLGLLLGQRGAPTKGLAMLHRSHALATDLDQRLLTAMSAHNMGYLASLVGDTPAALRWYESAELEFSALGDQQHVAIVGADRALTLVQAGLIAEARREADAVLESFESSDNVLDRAETQLIASRAALADGDRTAARQLALEARGAFARSRRQPWIPMADHVAFAAEDPDDAVDFDRLDRLVQELDGYGWAAESVHVRVVAAERLLRAGRRAEAAQILDAAQAPSHAMPVSDAIAAWTAQCLRCCALGDDAGARRAVTFGLRRLRRDALAVSAVDLRTYSVEHAKALATIALELAIRDHRPREFLLRTETIRSVSVTVGRSSTMRHTEGVADLLALLRVIGTERQQRIALGEPVQELDAEQIRVERLVRLRHRQGSLVAQERAVDLSAVEQLSAGAVHLAFEQVAGRFYSSVLYHDRVTLHPLSADSLADDIEGLRFAIARLARHGISRSSMQAAHDVVAELGARLGRSLLPDRVCRIGSLPRLIVSPDGSTGEIPWAAVPLLLSTPVTVAPSIASWAEARTRSRSDRRRLCAIAGPQLELAADEATAVGRRYTADTTVLLGEQATAAAALKWLGRCDIAHLACHGSFRSDSPLFSSLRLADGDLTFYDLEWLDRLPHTMVLSACHAGRSVGVANGSVFGLASALLDLGVSSVIAPLTPVNDERSVELMVRLHGHLAAGVEPADALARASVGPDGELDPTAAPFICFGS